MHNMSDRTRVGYYQSNGRYDFFTMLPPDKWSSPLMIDAEMIELEKKAMLEIDREQDRVRHNGSAEDDIKQEESIASCAIEGIKEDSEFVKNYILALNHIELAHELDEESLLNTFCLLMTESNKKPFKEINVDSYRNTIVQIGYLIPAPYWDAPILMKELFKFIAENRMNPLLSAAIVHVWFETIHPFNDGNGRMGRILILWMLLRADLIDTLCVTPSVYFLKNRQEYYNRLDKVRTDGDIEGWVKFFLKAFISE